MRANKVVLRRLHFCSTEASIGRLVAYVVEVTMPYATSLGQSETMVEVHSIFVLIAHLAQQ